MELTKNYKTSLYVKIEEKILPNVYLSDIIKKEIDEQKIVSIKSLYENLSKNNQLNTPQSKLRHRIRAAVYTLQENNYIQRIGNGIYQKR